jgi:hypothetical protein
MKKLIKNATGLILGMGVLLPNAKAQTVVLTQNAYSYYVGGEFNAVTSPDPFLPNYSPLAIVGDGFQTFCIETTVDFNPGTTYTYDLSTTASTGQPLTEGAALLYSEFAKGTLPGYDYVDTATRKANASELQAAIWWFQGQQTYPQYPSPTINNTYYEFATNALGANVDLASDGAYGVDVLQMWNSDGSPAQNQLVLGAPAPDKSATLLLLGMSLPALAMFRLRRVRC